MRFTQKQKEDNATSVSDMFVVQFFDKYPMIVA